MSNVQTHTFNKVKYKIDFVKSIEGVTDTKEKPEEPLEMNVLAGNDFIAFHSVFHESLEASGFCDKCLHFSDGTPKTIDAARFLWRLGYRTKK